MNQAEIILASQSPRRKELMALAGLRFTVQVSNVEEIVPEDLPSEKEAEYLASLKAKAVASENPDAIVVGSDTIVYLDGKVLGKPKTMEEAKDMLRMLSGKTHTVFTGVSICYQGEEEHFTSRTDVTFYELTEPEIEWYVSTKEPMDKAGAYGVQGFGCRLVHHIEGDYFTVMGLPIAEVVRRIEKISV